jgi:hypothetical protein
MDLTPSSRPFIYLYLFTLRRNRYLAKMRRSLAVHCDSDFEFSHAVLQFDGTNNQIAEQVKCCYAFEIERSNPRRRKTNLFRAGETIDFSLTPSFKYKIPTTLQGGCPVRLTVILHGFKWYCQMRPNANRPRL